MPEQAFLARATPEFEQSLTLSADQFRTFQRLAYRTFGLDLKAGKESLVLARLARRLRALSLPDIASYLKHLEQQKTGDELAILIDSLTTNFTSFLRESAHFDWMRDRILPELKDGSLSIWSAGCATGEEPYTILCHLHSVLGEPLPVRLKLLATDISNRALDAARAGVFPEARLKEIPPEWGRRFFQRGAGESKGLIRVKPHLVKMIQFERLNLMEPFEHVGDLDVIFCRNVMIYFDRPTQEALVGRLAARLRPGGWLLIGHSEGLMGMNHGLEHLRPAIYRKPVRGAGPGRRA